MLPVVRLSQLVFFLANSRAQASITWIPATKMRGGGSLRELYGAQPEPKDRVALIPSHAMIPSNENFKNLHFHTLDLSGVQKFQIKMILKGFDHICRSYRFRNFYTTFQHGSVLQVPFLTLACMNKKNCIYATTKSNSFYSQCIQTQ